MSNVQASGASIGAVSLLHLGLRALHLTLVGVDVLVAVILVATRGQSQPVFLTFRKAEGPGRDGRRGWGLPVLVSRLGSGARNKGT